MHTSIMDKWNSCNATIDEQFGKFILLNNEHDLTLFKSVERKQMHQCGSWCKKKSTLELANTNFALYICQTTCSSTSNHSKMGQKNSNQVWFMN
jgi:hypothetical protein